MYHYTYMSESHKVEIASRVEIHAPMSGGPISEIERLCHRIGAEITVTDLFDDSNSYEIDFGIIDEQPDVRAQNKAQEVLALGIA
jgi:hypothetical protein